MFSGAVFPLLAVHRFSVSVLTGLAGTRQSALLVPCSLSKERMSRMRAGWGLRVGGWVGLGWVSARAKGGVPRPA